MKHPVVTAYEASSLVANKDSKPNGICKGQFIIQIDKYINRYVYEAAKGWIKQKMAPWQTYKLHNIYF